MSMNGGRIERFFDTKFKRILFRWMMCILLIVSWIMKDVGVNKGFRIVFTCALWLIYGGFCAYVFKNGIDLRYDDNEDWDRYRMELKTDIVFGAVLMMLAIYWFLR